MRWRHCVDGIDVELLRLIDLDHAMILVIIDVLEGLKGGQELLLAKAWMHRFWSWHATCHFIRVEGF